jgi:hypothetical protein
MVLAFTAAAGMRAIFIPSIEQPGVFFYAAVFLQTGEGGSDYPTSFPLSEPSVPVSQ